MLRVKTILIFILIALGVNFQSSILNANDKAINEGASPELKFLLDFSNYVELELNLQISTIEKLKASCDLKLPQCDAFIEQTKKNILKVAPEMRLFLALSQNGSGHLSIKHSTDMSIDHKIKVNTDIHHPASEYLMPFLNKLSTYIPIHSLTPIDMNYDDPNSEINKLLYIFDEDTKEFVTKFKTENAMKRHLKTDF